MRLFGPNAILTPTSNPAVTGVFVDSGGRRAAAADVIDVKVPLAEAGARGLRNQVVPQWAIERCARYLGMHNEKTPLVSASGLDAAIAGCSDRETRGLLGGLRRGAVHVARARAIDGPLALARQHVEMRNATADGLIKVYRSEVSDAFTSIPKLEALVARPALPAEADRIAIGAIASTFAGEPAFLETLTALDTRIGKLTAMATGRITALQGYVTTADERHAAVQKIAFADRPLVDKRAEFLVGKEWSFQPAPFTHATPIDGEKVLTHVEEVGDVYVSNPKFEGTKEHKQLVGVQALLEFLIERAGR